MRVYEALAQGLVAEGAGAVSGLMPHAGARRLSGSRETGTGALDERPEPPAS